MKDNNKNSVPALAKGLAVIELLADSPNPLTQTEIARRLAGAVGTPSFNTYCVLLC